MKHAFLMSMMRFLLLLLILVNIGCGEQPQAGDQINQISTPEYELQHRDKDFYKIDFAEAETKDIYFFNLIDGYGQVKEFGAANIDEQACAIRFLVAKTGLSEYILKIGVSAQGTNTQECLILRGIFKLTLTGDHTAKIELINREIGFF